MKINKSIDSVFEMNAWSYVAEDIEKVPPIREKAMWYPVNSEKKMEDRY